MHNATFDSPWQAWAAGGRRGGRGGRGAGRRGGPWGPPFGPWGGPPPWAEGRTKARRGDVRAAILALLAEEPRNGYQLIQTIAERSHGEWRPSPGAVYPALQQLTDEGLIEGDEGEGRKTFRLSEAGRAYVEEHPEEVTAPWEAMTSDVRDDVRELFKTAAGAGGAVMQIVRTGSEAQVAQAKEILAETRRRLYHLLAEDE
ncbi:PadR family transcriptional regulator [Actinoallomurus spadix]|uniref:PadR family transcriptional regulator n=1 Tax=Actinoallomurus spadix TaxID=79912 RepID=A0ABP3FU51_9ACTN|nr:PadR family transcriptional regulator [Actinoallomurus spadix]MCO5986157.1 PadR family transcriptional regulator [Actinoallomurus spadix]